MPDNFRIGEFHVEPSLHSVSGPAGTVRLEAKVMHVLRCLAEHGDQVVPKERLMRAVWPDTFVERRRVDARHLGTATRLR